jgi:L-2-amino-thiazoline-4-carboxylic acid hydrolase-like protein
MEDTAHGQHDAPAIDPVVHVFASAIVDAVASYAANSPEHLEQTLRAEADRIANENEALAVDAAGRRWLTLCSVLLAGYRTLLPLVGGRPAALAVLQSAMTRPFTAGIHAFLRDRFSISQDAPEEAFERIAETFQSRGQERFGRAFRFVPDGRDEAQSCTIITKCLFNDFFRANDAVELTAVCCAMDYVWAEELAHPRYRVRFERPTTLAADDDACRFQFFRTSSAA